MSESALRIGVSLPTRQGAGYAGKPIQHAVELGERAEALGLDSVWAGESLLARPRFEPLTLLAAVAARTERVTLGTCVMLPALHAPVTLAQRLATLDALSRGRLVVGAGIGVDLPATRREYAAAGVPFERRVGRLVETVRACRTLWSSKPEAARDDAPGRLTADWDLRGIELEPRPHREGGPPFWIGATVAREAALRRTGRGFDGWIPTAPDPGTWATGWHAIQRAAREARREPGAITPSVYLTVSLDRDPAAAEARLGAFYTSYYGLPFDVMRRVQGCFAGSPEDCAAWLAGYVRAGVSHLVLRSPDLERDLEPLVLEVIPRLRGITGARAASPSTSGPRPRGRPGSARAGVARRSTGAPRTPAHSTRPRETAA
jgi:alkanesulfonate monooxygenase SsuD/methylene tetrahydromethanopterin reductase-like flavin-dependent oxidoreductase (luciferase family)